MKQRKTSLGGHFKQLQHLLLRWASERWRLNRAQYNDTAELQTVHDERAELVKGFVEKTLPEALPPWEQLAVKELPREQWENDHRRRRSRDSPGLDLTLIQSAYASLPPLDQATSETERSEWITFWKEALGCTLRMLGEEIEDDKEISGTPYDWDRWVFNHIVQLVTQLRPVEHPEVFWKPILSLGTSAHYWIEEYLVQWFTVGLSSEVPSQFFIREWQAMLEFAFSSSKWDIDLQSRWFRLLLLCQSRGS